MNVLWAPWRMAYVGADGRPPAGCLFCRVQASADDASHRVLTRVASAFLMLNAYPYASGHLMAVSSRHVGSLEDLSPDETGDLMALTGRALGALRTVYRPDGFNLGANIGSAAGAGIDGHLHLHVVPRWSGDTNFMPVVGSVKVLPESLDATYGRLRPHLG